MAERSSEELLELFQVLSDEIVARFARSDDIFRTQAVETAQKTVRRLQIPRDFSTVQTWAPAELAGATVASELGLFKILSSFNKAMTVPEITAKAKGSDLKLVNRIVRLLAAHGMVDQLSRTQYVANAYTHDYATPAREGNLYTQLNTMTAFAALPWFLRENGWKNSTDAKNCAWQHGLKTDQTLWEWNKARPEMAMHFNNFMSGARTLKSDSLANIYPFDELFKGSSVEDAIFVDVGGGLGHQCVNLRKSFPRSRGRIILQDLPFVIEGKQLEDVEVTTHDMMFEQPIKGAKAYYFRGVLHDHSDDVCRSFLRQIVKVMNAESKLLVHDQIVEAIEPSQFVTRMDLGMMTLFGGGERSAEEMRELLGSVGLTVVGTYQPGPRQWTITEAVLA